jgi:uridine kinase
LNIQERIIFVSYLAAQIGLAVITNAFPRVRIVTSMVDPNFNRKKLWIEPGIGNFGGKFLY